MNTLLSVLRGMPPLSPECVPVLVERFADRHARKEALYAIERMGPAGKAAMPAVLKLLEEIEGRKATCAHHWPWWSQSTRPTCPRSSRTWQTG